MKTLFDKWKLLFYVSLLTVSCSDSSQQTAVKNESSTQSTKVSNKPPSSFLDTIDVNFPVAVFYRPDSVQLNKIRSVTDTMIFEGTMHDCFFQMKYSQKVLKQYYPKVQIREISKGRFIRFQRSNGEVEIIDLDTKNDPCGLFISDGRQSPILVDMTNIETILSFHFPK